MRSAILLCALALLGCATTGEARPADTYYVMTVTTSHPDDIILYLYSGSRQRLGRIPGYTGRASFRIPASAVGGGRTHVVGCIGAWTPSAVCRDLGALWGAYPPRDGRPGTIKLHLMRGLGNVAGVINGED